MKKRLLTAMLIISLAFSLVSCKGSSAGQNTSIDTGVETGMLLDFYEAVKQAYGEDYVPGEMLDEDDFEETFGIDAKDTAAYFAEVSVLDGRADTFVGIEAKEGEAKNIEDELSSYRKRLVKSVNLYPEDTARINASEVYRIGNYVFFILLGNTEMEEADGQDQYGFAEAQVQRGIEAIAETAEK